MRWQYSADASNGVLWEVRWRVPEASTIPDPTPPSTTGGSPPPQHSGPQPATGGVPASDGQATDAALAAWPIPQGHRLAVIEDFD
eukprot:8782462-Lingulodinium_polyedra.AAC.1